MAHVPQRSDGSLAVYGQAGNRNVQVSVIGMHDMTFHQRGDQV